MATIDIACPKCGNKSKGPDTLKGKKIRCKQCEHVFVVPDATNVTARKPAPAVQDQVKTVPPDSFEEEKEIAKNPYGVVEENLAPRCPHCALPLDPPDATICIHCGYHMRKRQREESKETYEITATDILLWQLPTVACFFGILALIGLCVYCGLVLFPDMIADSWLEGIVPSGCFTTWLAIICLWLMWKQAKLIFYRLSHFTPPEQIKRKRGED